MKSILFSLSIIPQDENKRKQDEQGKIDKDQMNRLKEAENVAQAHDDQKTAHYARLGGTFVNKASPLLSSTRATSNMNGGRGRGFTR